MPSAPVFEMDETEVTADPSVPSELPVPATSAIHAVPAVHAVSVASTAVPTAQVAVPTQPTARIHWVGSFVNDRHPADLYAEMVAGTSNLVIVDARYPETYALEHLPGAISLPWREVDEATTADLPREALYVVYCWNASCHASTKTAQRLAALGFKIKELHGGLQDWKKQGYPTERA